MIESCTSLLPNVVHSYLPKIVHCYLPITWSDLKIKLNQEGSQLYDKIVQLKMLAFDGKMRDTDAADTEHILRLIQSIPSIRKTYAHRSYNKVLKK